MAPHSSSADDVGRTFSPSTGDLHDILLRTEDVGQFLQELAEVASTIGGDEVAVGITVARDGYPATVASSDVDASRYDEVQYRHGEGPCLTAMRTAEVVRIEDLRSDERFSPEYREHAATSGLRSVLSLPLEGGEDAVGALNMYAKYPHAFDAQEEREYQRFAHEAARALNLAVRMTDHMRTAEQLRAALTSRTVIDQAIGIVMGQNRCTPEEAFAILRTASQHRNVKLRTVAQEIVTSISGRSARTEHSG